MPQFTKFIERRERVEAFCFNSFGLAEDVAQALEADKYDLHVANGGWEFWMELTHSKTPNVVVRVNRGDYVTKDGEVVSRAEFVDKWEVEK